MADVDTDMDNRRTVHDAMVHASQNGAFDANGGIYHGAAPSFIANNMRRNTRSLQGLHNVTVLRHVMSWLVLNRDKTHD